MLTKIPSPSSPIKLSAPDTSATSRRSNLVVKGVVVSVKRELKDTTGSSSGKSGIYEDKHNRPQADEGNNSDTVFEAFRTTVPNHLGTPSNNTSAAMVGMEDTAEGKLEHIATFVLDASTDAYAALQSSTSSASNIPSALQTPTRGLPSSAASLALRAAKVPANTITLRLTDDWALSTSFVSVGDIIEASRFDVQYTSGGYTSGGSLLMVANSSTELHVTRMKHIAINAINVGQLEVLELTEREQAEARHAFTNIPPQRFGDKNVFAHVDLYYDIIKGQSATINPQMSFLQSLFGFRTSVLDAGCGSGLYSFAFRGYGVYPVCIDASHTMQRRFEEKNHFFQQAEAHQKKLATTSVTITDGAEAGVGAVDGSPVGYGNEGRSTLMARKAQKALALRGTSELEFHLADLASFSLAKRDADGNVRYTEFEGVLCLDVLALLPDISAIRAALHNLSLHTGRGGVVVLSIPNASVVLDKGCHMSTAAYPIDRFKLSVGAASVPHRDGTLHLTEVVLIDNADAATSNLYKVPTQGGGKGNGLISKSAAPSMSNLHGGNMTTSSMPATPSRGPNASLGSVHNSAYPQSSSVRPPPASSNQQVLPPLILTESLARRVTTWRGTAFHPSAPGNANKFVSFVETFTELLMPAGVIEQLFTECGFVVKALYGTLTGEAFMDTYSDTRYYVLQRA